jgi:hypothetical protein
LTWDRIDPLATGIGFLRDAFHTSCRMLDALQQAIASEHSAKRSFPALR